MVQLRLKVATALYVTLETFRLARLRNLGASLHCLPKKLSQRCDERDTVLHETDALLSSAQHGCLTSIGEEGGGSVAVIMAVDRENKESRAENRGISPVNPAIRRIL